MPAAPKSEWKERNNDDFHAAFVFLDEYRRTRFSPAQMPANTPGLATRLSKAGAPNLVFAHPLVGPSDLLAGVKGDTFRELVGAIQTKIRKNVKKKNERKNFVYEVQSHLVISMEGRIDFSKQAFDRKRPIKGKKTRTLRAWVLATAANPAPRNTSKLAKALSENRSIKLVANVLGRYDYFIFVETRNIKELQSVVDRCIRRRREFIATDTRIVMHE
jgi:AsnC-like helix-turn-helix protein